jgi:hypothetical protein
LIHGSWLPPRCGLGIRRVLYPTPPLRARGSLDRHATYIVAVYVAGAAR